MLIVFTLSVLLQTFISSYFEYCDRIYRSKHLRFVCFGPLSYWTSLIDCIWQNNKKCKNMVPNSNLLEGPNVSSKLTSVTLKTHGDNWVEVFILFSHLPFLVFYFKIDIIRNNCHRSFTTFLTCLIIVQQILLFFGIFSSYII